MKAQHGALGILAWYVNTVHATETRNISHSKLLSDQDDPPNYEDGCERRSVILESMIIGRLTHLRSSASSFSLAISTSSSWSLRCISTCFADLVASE